MADDKDREGLRILPLTKANHESWFRQNRIKLRGKGVFYTCEVTLRDYAQIALAEDMAKITTGVENLDIEEKGTKTRIVLNLEKKRKYQEDEATGLSLLFRSLNEDDQALNDQYEAIFDFWAYLKNKYSQTDSVTAKRYMTKIQTFTFAENMTITSAWEKLNKYRRKLVNANATLATTYPDETLYIILQEALPEEYSSTIDTLDVQISMDVDAKLKHLEEKERRIAKKGRKTDEHANAAVRSRGRNEKYTVPQRRASNDSLNSENELKCYLCEKSHRCAECPYLEPAQQYVKIIIKEIHKAAKAKISSRDASKPKNAKYAKPESKASRKKAHGMVARGEELSPTSDSDDSDSSDGGASMEETDEAVFLSTELLSKATPSSWPADSGASSHMSDQPDLFRDIKHIKRRSIRVGGGVMYTDHKGTVDMVCEDGSSMLLSDVLYVPGLGVNLLSARRVCQNGLEGTFNHKKMFFKRDGQTVIEASMRNGLYIVTHVADGYEETAFSASSAAEHKDAEMETVGIPQVKKLTPKQETNYYLWHRRMNHLNPEKIRNLHKVTTLSSPIKVPSDIDICEVCCLTKMTNRLPKKLAEHKDRKLALIQFDVAGPLPISARKNRYFLLIIDSYTRENWVICLQSRDGAILALKTWKKDVEFQTKLKILAARTDNAPELLKAIDGWRDAGSGIRKEQTTAATSHQNGPAERNIRTAEADARAMLKEAGLPIEFWDEAVEYDAYVRNRTDTGPVIDGSVVSPHEAYTGETPSIDHLRVWGYRAFAYINPKTIPANQRHDKLMDTARVGVFMGFPENTTKQVKIYCPDLGYTQRFSRYVIDEKTRGGEVSLHLRTASGPQGITNDLPDRLPRGRPKKGKPVESEVLEKSKTVPQVILPSSRPPHGMAYENHNDKDLPEEPEVEAVETQDEPTPAPIEAEDERTTPETRAEKHKSDNTAPQTDDSGIPDILAMDDKDDMDIGSDNDTQPRYFTRSTFKRKRSESETVTDSRARKIIRAMIAQIALGEMDDEIADIAVEDITDFDDAAFPAKEVLGIKIPATYREAVNDPKYGQLWKQAIIEELNSLMDNGTWEQVVPPKDANIISCKWVFDIKKLTSGAIERFKARLVARGFSQVMGVDYNDTFAPTVRMETLRLFFAMVARKNLQCSHFDIKNAFTESHLKEKILMEPPLGLKVKKGMVLKVLRSLYGLKQAARDWNQLIKKELLSWGFVQSLADPCMFTHKENSLVLLVYVDDIAAAAKTQEEIDWFWTKLSKRFKAKPLGEISKILGVRVVRDRANRTIYLD
jgi:hypothetical protein